MRIAVALPSLPQAAPERRLLDSVFERIEARGVRVDRYGEADRCRQDERVTHYLKFPRRHAAEAYDNALYPLGRDYRSWETAFLMGRKLPGVTWVLDPVPGHMATAAIALRNRWDAHREAMEAEFGADVAGVAIGVLASGWADRSFHRRFDLMVPTLRDQRALVWRDGTAPSGESEPETVPLPAAATSEPASAEPRASERLVGVVLNFNARWPQPLLRAVARLGTAAPDLDLTLGYPAPFDAHVRGEASRMGLEPDLLPVADGARLRERVEAADLVLLLEPEATAAEMALLQSAMARGRCTLLPEAPPFASVPAEAAVRLPMGRSLEVALAATLETLAGDPELRRGVGEAARRFVADRTPDSVAAALSRILERTAGPAELSRPAAATWDGLAATLADRMLPTSATAEQERAVRDGIASKLPIPGRSA